jgi:hypothetical protein
LNANTANATTAALPPDLSADELVRLYEQMLLLRRFELAAQVACRKGETPGFLHLYIGQEASGVGVCAHLRIRRLRRSVGTYLRAVPQDAPRAALERYESNLKIRIPKADYRALSPRGERAHVLFRAIRAAAAV